MGAAFKFDEEKGIATIVFLASRGIPELTKGKICKLIFLADKQHLVRFGRPVTGDRLCAMKDGPVPSGILNLLNSVLRDPNECPVLGNSIFINRSFTNPRFEAKSFGFADCLSDSDIEALNATVHLYGPQTFSELRRMTHELPAYKKAWTEDRPHNAPEMAFEDLFEEDDEAIQGALEEMTENAEIGRAFAPPRF